MVDESEYGEGYETFDVKSRLYNEELSRGRERGSERVSSDDKKKEAVKQEIYRCLSIVSFDIYI